MPWPSEELKRRFDRPENAELLRYLEEHGPSAHSDLGILVRETARELPGAGYFGPNITACSYVFSHTRSNVAFVLAVDMRSLVFRLSEPDPNTKPFARIGSDWHELDPFDPARSKGDAAALVRRLAAAAFAYAERAS